MKKRVIALLLLAVMLVGALAACGKEELLTEAEVKKIVTDHACADGSVASSVDFHGIGETKDGQVCYQVYITINGKTFLYQVHATSGEILSITESSHSHSH